MRQWSREDWLTLIVIPLLVLMALLIPAYISREQRRQELHIVCANSIANHSELAALAVIGRELGVPIHFQVPEVPPECADFLRP